MNKLFSLLTGEVFAAPPGGGGPSGGFSIDDVFSPALRISRGGGFGTFGDLATVILTILTTAAGAIAVIFIIIAGIKFVTSSGDEKKLASAASTITYAIIGLIVTALAFVILQIVQYLLGAKVGTI